MDAKKENDTNINSEEILERYSSSDAVQKYYTGISVKDYVNNPPLN